MILEIISPEKTIFKGEVDSVNLPGSAGGFTVLPRHAALISSLKQGEISYNIGDAITTLTISSGFAEVRDEVVSVCVEKVLDK